MNDAKMQETINASICHPPTCKRRQWRLDFLTIKRRVLRASKIWTTRPSRCRESRFSEVWGWTPNTEFVIKFLNESELGRVRFKHTKPGCILIGGKIQDNVYFSRGPLPAPLIQTYWKIRIRIRSHTFWITTLITKTLCLLYSV